MRDVFQKVYYTYYNLDLGVPVEIFDYGVGFQIL